MSTYASHKSNVSTKVKPVAVISGVTSVLLPIQILTKLNCLFFKSAKTNKQTNTSGLCGPFVWTKCNSRLSRQVHGEINTPTQQHIPSVAAVR